VFLAPVPSMLHGGTEFGRSQAGNNNAYCQDNEISWWDWSIANSEAGRDMRRFVARLITLRQQQEALHQRHFLHGHGEPAPGILDIAWFEAGGELITEDSWKKPEIRLL